MKTRLKDIEEFIEKNREVCDVGRPATEKLIDKAEEYLGVQFPDDYREFLKKWGSLSIGPLEFYGICKDDFINSSVPDAIWYTQQKRQQLGLLKEVVIVCENNGVEFYCLDTSSSDGSRIVVWEICRRKIRAIEADLFFEFVLNEAVDSV